MSNFIQQIITSFLTSNTLSLLINHLIQVYCFTYSILCLLTSLLTLTNFIYADYLLKVKPIGIASFILFYAMKLWTSFDSWMVWINYVIALYIGLYFYEACCRITERLNHEETANKHGAILIVVDVLLVGLWIGLRKAAITQNSKKLGLFGQHQNYIYLALILILFGVNLYRMNHRSLFPCLIAILIMTSTLVVRQLLLTHNFSKNLPLQSLIYLAFVIDAQGRQYVQCQNQVFHHIFLTGVYFYGFVITNERMFSVEYFFIAVCIVMLAFNK